MTKPTPAEAKIGWTDKKLEAFLAEAEKRTAERVFAVFDRRPGLRHERAKSAFDWLRSGPNPNDWARRK